MTNKRKKELGYISFLQAIGCLLVVLGHSYPVNSIPPSLFLAKLKEFIYCFHMPLFTFVSGYLFIYTGSIIKKGYINFIRGKAVRLLVPYVVLSAAAVFPKYLVSQYINDNVNISIGYYIHSLLVPRENIWGHLWFLPTLFLFFIINPVFNRAIKSKSFIIILSSLLLGLRIVPFDTGWFALSDFSKLVLFFWLGCLVGKQDYNKLKCYLKPNLGLVAFLLAIGVFVISPISNSNLNMVVKTIIAILMIFCLICLGLVYSRQGRKYLRWLDEYAYTIYLLSWPVQAPIDILLYKILHINWYVVSVIMFISGICVPLLLIKFLNMLDSKRLFKPVYTSIGL